MVNTNKLKGRIVEKGFSQKEIAKLLHLAQPSVNQKLNGKRAMTLEEAFSLSKILDIKPLDFPNYFFYDSNCVTQRSVVS